MPLSIVTEVALLVVHESVELSPLEMEVGFALKLIDGGGFVVVPTVILIDVLGIRPA
jgi:hypothetical protein